jgi:hypothetical protein
MCSCSSREGGREREENTSIGPEAAHVCICRSKTVRRQNVSRDSGRDKCLLYFLFRHNSTLLYELFKFKNTDGCTSLRNGPLLICRMKVSAQISKWTDIAYKLLHLTNLRKRVSHNCEIFILTAPNKEPG